jgi:biopolymer transport protein ExbB/TolQ
LGRITTSENTDYKKLREAAAAGDTARVRSVAANSSSPVALSLAQGLSAPVLALGRERLRESVGRGITTQTAFLQNNLQYLATIASTAPYIGLFGTVLGILGAFRQIAATGETGPAVVSGSISEALITTALGLGVAIPAAIGYNLLLARVNAMSLTVENHALEVADLIADHDPQEGA